MKTLHNSTLEALAQVEQLILAFQTNNKAELYNIPPANVMSGVGKHIRHILDHFLAFQQGLVQGCIDYNVRHREGRLEEDPTLALDLLRDISQWLKTKDIPDKAIDVESEISVSQHINIRFSSSVNRELCYLVNHTIHHVAYAKLLMSLLDIELDDEIGIAPSTATYLRGESLRGGSLRGESN
jgi:uncharacterized damage-inducible protein DinB